MEQQSQELDSWIEIVKKTVNAKAKTGLQLVLFIREMNQTKQQRQYIKYLYEKL